MVYGQCLEMPARGRTGDGGLGINPTRDLGGGHAEYELAENCALTQAQGPVSGTSNRTDWDFLEAGCIPQLLLKIWVESE